MNKVEQLLTGIEQRILTKAGVEFLTYDDVDMLVLQLACKLDFEPDAVVGIKNGGAYPAQKLAETLDVPYIGFNVSREDVRVLGVRLNDRLIINKFPGVYRSYDVRVKERFMWHPEIETMLLVDDDCGTGRTIETAKQEIQRFNDCEIRTATLFVNKDGYMPDYYAEMQKMLHGVIKGGKRFPWIDASPYYKH